MNALFLDQPDPSARVRCAPLAEPPASMTINSIQLQWMPQSINTAIRNKVVERWVQWHKRKIAGRVRLAVAHTAFREWSRANGVIIIHIRPFAQSLRDLGLNVYRGHNNTTHVELPTVEGSAQ